MVLKIGSAAGAARLRREAGILERLSGGPVPALLGQDLSCREPWVAMTWIDGIPLDRLPESLSVADRKAVLLQACLAVARLHGARMVHADLSAANLIARPHGEVAVVDFGLSPVPGSDEIPEIGGAWEILAPERLQGGASDPRWDVFALGVIGARLLGGILPPEASRDEWTNFVASGEASLYARGRSWTLSLALDPDPSARPSDAAALVRLLEKEWGDPPFSRDLLAGESARRLEDLFAAGVRAAEARRDWDAAWRLQRERIERAADPEPLLPALGEYQRKRRDPPEQRWIRGGIFAGLGLAACLAFTFGWGSGASDDQPADLAPAVAGISSEFHDIPEKDGPAPNGVLVFDPPPQGARLEIDDRSVPPPPDGFLRLRPGTHRVLLTDSSDEILLDTTLRVPAPERRTRPRGAWTDSDTASVRGVGKGKGKP